MKQKYAALLLGLTLAISSVGVYAEEAENSSESNLLEEDTDSKQQMDEDEGVYGKVTKVSDTNITIELGTIQPISEESADALTQAISLEISETAENSTGDTESADSDSSSEEMNMEISESDDAYASEESSFDFSDYIALEFDGTSQIISITDNTEVLMIQPDAALDEESSDLEIIGGADGSTLIEIMDEDTPDSTEVADEAAESSADSDNNPDIAASESIDEDDLYGTDGDDTLLSLIPVYENSDTAEIALSDIREGAYVKITLDEQGSASVITVLLDAPEALD